MQTIINSLTNFFSTVFRILKGGTAIFIIFCVAVGIVMIPAYVAMQVTWMVTGMPYVSELASMVGMVFGFCMLAATVIITFDV